MYWADRISEEIIKSGKFSPYWVDDMKTPSGYAHIGSLLGPVIHSTLYRALKNKGQKATFTFVINDFDPADDLLPELRGKFEQYLGMPLKLAPSPVPGFESMADLFGQDFITSIKNLGVEAEILSSWDLYHEGKFDEVIRMALDNAEKIQDIYQRIAGSKKKEAGWLPLQVICENCRKLGTTRVYGWDGEKVSYKCELAMVKWAQGCGHEGKVSPFGGTGKLPWKVDWAAHWKVLGITIEGAGKDHASAGGSYDIAMEIVKEVFNYPQPYKLPYEFILIGGRKMSSSKGIGLKAHDLVKILPPQVGRFLFVARDIKSQANFDPNGTMAIPDLFDEHDRAWRLHITDPDHPLARAFVYAQTNGFSLTDDVYLPRFRDVANYLQMPNVSLVEKFENLKGGKLTKEETTILDERRKYAQIWLENYAPEDFRLQMTSSFPELAKDFTPEQKKFLHEAAKLVEKEMGEEELQLAIYNLSKELKVPSKEAFGAIYRSFLGKDHGPKAAWLLKKYPQEKVIERLVEASK
ncbi:MAG: lysine--tRNA ligase [Candidatus Blackburnbacteria bacterium]|nr:lysine--tRNA ligase [Candidatus Blackburnbacteria bacterium]